MILQLAGGLVLLVAGAELLVRGASRLASSFGVPPLVVGLTVVAFGTSSPEMAVSTAAAVEGRTELALGNVAGSNVFNVLFILGLSALVVPLVVKRQVVRQEVPVMIGVSALVLVLALDGGIGRVEGLLLFVALCGYTWVQIVQGRRSRPAVETGPPPGSRVVSGVLALAGLALLVLGSDLFVAGASALARRLGLSELTIGLTIVAGGTSLPEVATSLVAALRGERDIAVGNVVGSNVFNLLGVLGLSAAVAPGGIPVAPAALRFDLVVVLAVAVACLPICFTDSRIARWEGGVFLAYYVAYVTYLVLSRHSPEDASALGEALLFYALPLTALTLGILAVREWSRR